jgi:pyruvate kinase
MRDHLVKTLINHQLVNEMKEKRVMKTELSVTLWPSFPHFKRFVNDDRITGIRLNSAMMSNPELDKELEIVKKLPDISRLFFDIKGRQLRVTEVIPNQDHLDIRLNHSIKVKTPCVVLFKAGADVALLDHLEEDGQRLVFQGGPRYKVTAGESLHIRDTSLQVEGDIFTPLELEKIAKVRKAGFTKYFLSYVEQQSDVDQFLELVGRDAEVWLKIESLAGMQYVARSFQKKDNLVLVAARGDLFVELEKPHHMMDALKTIIKTDPVACVGSRLLLSVINSPVPSCADLIEIAWLHDIGYRRMMLCDELCLKENMLAGAVAVFDGIKNDL